MIIIRILFFSLRKVSYRTSVTFQRIKKETDCRPETVSYLILIYEIMAGFIERVDGDRNAGDTEGV